MEEVNGIKFDKGFPKELDGEVVSEDKFDEIEEAVDLNDDIRFGKRPWDAPPGKVKIWVEQDEEEEDE